MKKPRIFQSRTAAVLFYLAFAFFFIFLLSKNSGTLRLVTWDSALFFAMVLVFTIVHFFCLGVVNSVTFNFGEKRINLLDGYKLAAVNTIGNYLPLSGGLIAKGFLLKKRHNIDYAHYAAISVYTMICALVVRGAAGVYSTIIIRPDYYPLLTGFALMAASGVFLLVPFPRLSIIARIVPMDKLREAGLIFRGAALKTIAVHTVILFVSTAKLLFSFLIIGQSLSFLNVMLLVSGVVLTRFFTLTPGAIGVREGIIAALAHITGIDYQISIIAVGIDRMAEILIVFVTSMTVHLWERIGRLKGAGEGL